MTTSGLDLVDTIERAAAAHDAEGVLDGIDELPRRYHERPRDASDACLLLARSSESSVRVAMACRGVPHIYNHISEDLAVTLADELSEDVDDKVRDAMSETLKAFPR